MGRIGLFLSLIILSAAAQAYSADDVVTRAMKLYEKRHYVEVMNVLRSDAASIEPAKQGSANLTLGMAYFKNAVLHRELYQASALATHNYLKKLSAAQGKDRSRFVDLYFGDALIETGKPGVAAIYLEKFSSNESVEPRFRSIAKVRLGLCFYLSNDARKAVDLWSAVETTDPEVKSELAAVYSRVGLADKNPAALADECLAEATRTGKPISMRMVKNLLSVYARAGLTDKGLDLLKRADLKAYSYRETLGKSKIINFYDLSLLGDMATIYGQASLVYLEKAAGDLKARAAAEFYLGQAYALFGSIDQSMKITATFTTLSPMPRQYKDRIRVWQGANLFQKDRRADAIGVWNELARMQPSDPDLLAEILFACARLKTECREFLQKATASVEAGEGKKFSNLNIAIGKYYLGRLDNAKSVSYLEAGRDKSNKNKIESNDPAMLVNLADAYLRTKKFSEGLEIYFEMSKQFPEVRQIQEAVQGVYAMEHKSAGDVKIN